MSQPLRRLSNNASGFKGIYWDRRTTRYRAQIKNPLNGKRRSTGYFQKPEDAARAYDELAREFYGEDAALNFPVGQEPRVFIGLQKDIGVCPSGHPYESFGSKQGDGRQINCRICNLAAVRRYELRCNVSTETQQVNQ